MPKPLIETTCPSCGRTSHTARETRHRFCAICGGYDDVMKGAVAAYSVQAGTLDERIEAALRWVAVRRLEMERQRLGRE